MTITVPTPSSLTNAERRDALHFAFSKPGLTESDIKFLLQTSKDGRNWDTHAEGSNQLVIDTRDMDAEARLVSVSGPGGGHRWPLSDAERKHRRRIKALAKAARRRNRR